MWRLGIISLVNFFSSDGKDWVCLKKKRKKKKEHVCRTSMVSNKKKGKEKEHVLFLQAHIERQQINRKSHELARAATGDFWAQISC